MLKGFLIKNFSNLYTCLYFITCQFFFYNRLYRDIRVHRRVPIIFSCSFSRLNRLDLRMLILLCSQNVPREMAMASRIAHQLCSSGATGTAYNVLALATPRKQRLKQQHSDLNDVLTSPIRNADKQSPMTSSDSAKKSKKTLLRLFSSKTPKKGILFLLLVYYTYFSHAIPNTDLQ